MPPKAVEALARRLLTGAKCSCGKLVALDDAGGIAYQNPFMTGGARLPLEQARACGTLRWRRGRGRWISSMRAKPSRRRSRIIAVVKVLTAEVRTLMVGSRQVTLSVYGQLDHAPPEYIEPFGRVRIRAHCLLSCW